jgi:hypothetical protein
MKRRNNALQAPSATSGGVGSRFSAGEVLR